MFEELVTIKSKVRYILEKHPETRDSDKLLWLAYMCIFHDLKSMFKSEDEYKRFRTLIMNSKSPTFESIRRVRQKYQEAGEFVGKKRADRMDESEVMRTNIRQLEL